MCIYKHIFFAFVCFSVSLSVGPKRAGSYTSMLLSDQLCMLKISLVCAWVIRKNDVLNVLSQEDEHCWVGELNGLVGWFPAKLVEVHSYFNQCNSSQNIE